LTNLVESDGNIKEILIDYVLSTIQCNEEWIERLKIAGIVYTGKKNQLYLPFHIFRELVCDKFPHLRDKLPTLKQNFTWEHFESLDLQAFCSRINCLINQNAKSRKNIGMDEKFVKIQDFFPGAFISYKLNTMRLGLPKQCHIKIDDEQFINNQYKVNLRLLIQKEESLGIIHRTARGCTAVDAFWITTSSFGDKVMLCKQYSMTGTDRQSYKNPLEWANNLYEKLRYVETFNGYEFIFILITNAKVPESKRPPITETINSFNDFKGQKNLILVSKECAKDYFSPNLLPYYSFIENLPETDRISASQQDYEKERNLNVESSDEDENVDIQGSRLLQKRKSAEVKQHSKPSPPKRQKKKLQKEY
jgi:hypothetical protein